MKCSKVLATLMLSTLLITGCGVKDQQAIIKINDGVITQKEYNEMMDQQIAQSPLGGVMDIKGNKDGFLYLMTEQRVINQLIIEEILEQEAKSRNIKVSNKDVNESIKKIMDKMGGREQLANVLKQNGLTVSEFKKDIKKQVKMQKLANSVGKIKVTNKDCEKFYKENLDKFKHAEQVRASHILVEANPYLIQQEITAKTKKEMSEKELKAKVEKVMAERKAKAQKLAKELQTDKSKFTAYAKKYSQDPNSAKQGGDLGFFAQDKMVKEFADAAFSLKPDTISDVVKTQFGYHIIIVTDRREAGVMPYEKVKSDIKDYLQSSQQITALDELTQAAKKKSKIEFMDERYNPEKINEKLHKTVNEISGGAADKLQNQKKQENK